MVAIRQVIGRDEFEAVSRFRYRIYVDEMRRKQKYADHERKTITDPLDGEGVGNLAAWEGGEVVGVVRINFLQLTDIGDYFEQYDLGGLPPGVLAATSITTRLMIHPGHRRGTLAARLACETYRYGLARGITTDFIDCNAHLVSFFTGLGYVVHRDDLVHPEYGAVTVMRLNVTDLDHLERVRSPFRKILRSLNNRAETLVA
jgi:hypothetical protein